MATSGYRIEDEPLPGPLQRIAVNPFWPLLAVMFGGAWVSWPWFLVNGFAIGSPTRRREVAIVVAGLAGSVVLVVALLALAGSGSLDRPTLRYAAVGLTVWKLGVSYWLYTLQSRCFGLYEHFGGPVRNGVLVLIAAAFLAPTVLRGAHPVVRMVLG